MAPPIESPLSSATSRTPRPATPHSAIDAIPSHAGNFDAVPSTTNESAIAATSAPASASASASRISSQVVSESPLPTGGSSAPLASSFKHRHFHNHSHSHSPSLHLHLPIRSASSSGISLNPTSPRLSEDEAGRHVRSTKKLQKRRPGIGSGAESIQQTHTEKAMEFPDRLNQNAEGEEEVIRPIVTGNSAFVNMNQSVFGMIAAAGSRVNFNDRFEAHTSDSEEEDDDNDAEESGRFGGDGAASPSQMYASTTLPEIANRQRGKQAIKDTSQSAIYARHTSTGSSSGSSAKDGNRRTRFTDSKLMRSLPSLKKRLSSSKRRSSPGPSSKASDTGGAVVGAGSSRILEEDEDADSSANSAGSPASAQARLPQSSSTTSDNDMIRAAVSERSSSTPSQNHKSTRGERSNSVRSIPVMSRMLEAKAELAALRPSFDFDRKSKDKSRGSKGGHSSDDTDDAGPTALSRRLMEIFEFDRPEEVIEEYPCWLLQSVLLQGYMYITSRHICFYAYLPKKANEVAKSGYLAKSGKRNPRYNRFWFRLKGDVFSYYKDPNNLYFPHGQIDLRYGISATITAKDKEGLHFTVVTHHRTYYFRADSAPSAKEWVKSLQRVIFRSHNDGDSVKISLPIDNVIDIEENQAMVEFTETCKIRVIDNDETFAIDEYFFSFFDYGKDAVRVLKILIEANNRPSSGLGTPVHGRRLDLPSASQGTDDRASQESSDSAAFGADQERISMSKGPRLHDTVRATLSPTTGSNPRASGEIPRLSFDALRSSFSPSRRSVDLNQALGGNLPRRSFSDRFKRTDSQQRVISGSGRRTETEGIKSAAASPQQYPSDVRSSIDSFMQSSVEDPSHTSFSNLAASSSDDPTGSQILHHSDVFQKPTIAGDAELAPTASPRTSDKTPHRAKTTGHIRKGHATTHSSSDVLQDGVDIDASLAQNLTRLGTYPLQRAGAYAGWLNRTSRRVSTMLATESMGYVEKVSGMWKGGRQHYDGGVLGSQMEEEAGGMATDIDPGMSIEDQIVSNDHFREHFSLPETEKLQATYFGSMLRVLPLYGKIYLSQRYFCYRSLVLGTRTKLILPLKDIETVNKEKGFRFTYSGLVLVIRGHEEIFFEFQRSELRDDCAVTMLRLLDRIKAMKMANELADDDKAGVEAAEAALAERDALKEAREEAAARQDEHAETPAEAAAAAVSSAKAVIPSAVGTTKEARQKRKLMRQSALMAEAPTILFDDPKASFLNFKPSKPLHITCLTIGSRGDVQPYIALGRGLLAEGHHVRIATHPEFEDWIRSHGLDYGRVEGDPAELMRICIENGTFTFQFLREANAKMRTWLEELLSSAWTACQGTDLLIESPSAMAGIHIAERLQIPYFRAFTMPWTRTRAYPHAFLMPERKMGGAYNQLSYTMFEAVFWRATASQINRWRNTVLGLRNTTLEKMQINKVPFLYNFSACVVPPPLDWSDWIRVTGYWFLDEGTTSKATGIDAADGTAAAVQTQPKWEPPQDLLDFIAKARADHKKLVYVGFGSIVVPDPAKMTQEVIDAVRKADVRCILSKGWSDRLVRKNGDAPPPEDVMPPEIFSIKSAPHDWLFAQIDAAAHHGGSGTTGASLRAGIPTIIRPFFGDQFFFGQRVEDLGVGLCLKKWGAISFARALWEATNSERMIRKAAVLGEQIREERGVDTAIQSIYRDMEYAKSLVRHKALKNGLPRPEDDEFDDDDTEENWTFVGDDDPMRQSMILPVTPDEEGVGQMQGFHAGGGGGVYKALGSRILGMTSTASK